MNETQQSGTKRFANNNFQQNTATRRNPMTFKDLMREKLASLGLSQNAVERKIGLSYGRLSKFMDQTEGIGEARREKLAELIGMSPAELLEAYENMRPDSKAEPKRKAIEAKREQSATPADEREIALERERLTLGWERLGMAREVERMRFEALKRAMSLVSDAISSHSACLAREEELRAEGKADAAEEAHKATEAARARILRAEADYAKDAEAYADSRRASFAVLDNPEGPFGFPAVPLRPKKDGNGNGDGNGHNGGATASR